MPLVKSPMLEKLTTRWKRWWCSEGTNADSPAFSDTVVISATPRTLFEQLFDVSAEGLVLCDSRGHIVTCNAKAVQICGSSSNVLVGRSASELIRAVSTTTGDDMHRGRFEALLQHASGHSVRVWTRQTELHDGLNPRRLLHLAEIDQPSSDQSRPPEFANYDSLTKLPNRALFRDRLTQAMKRAQRSGVPFALMFLDLDRFKVVNDSLGHQVGDRLLIHVAEQLTQCLRSIDSVSRPGADDMATLSRLGGDEFTVIAEAVTTAEHAGFVAQRLLDAVSAPFLTGEEKIVMEASIGIALYPDENVDLDVLIRHADLAMYRSKSLGRGMFSFFSDDMNEAVSNRLSLESNLRRAMEDEEFELHYQPKVDAVSGEVTGVEALLRWNSPTTGMVRPDHFISVLEDTGMIVPIGAWVIRKACADLAHWDRLNLPPLRMAVNMSARQFRHQHLASLIEDTLCQNGIDPGRLEIELTESLLMEDNEASRNMLANFARIGVRLAIDDFGTGHSSLAYLKRFNVDTLKIDRSFVSALPDDTNDKAIASAVIAMGHSMHMRIVAEGVETDGQSECLRGLGCDELQGYLISRPLSEEKLVDWLREYQAARVRSGRTPRHFQATVISKLMSLEDTVPHDECTG